jgi:flagellar motor component MotA
MDELRRSIAVLKSLEANIVLSSIFGPILGIIAMLKNVGDLASLAAGLAIVLLTLMYGVLFILFFSYPFKHHLQAEAAGRA